VSARSTRPTCSSPGCSRCTTCGSRSPDRCGDGSRTLADLPAAVVQDTLTRFGQSAPPGLVQDVLLSEERKFGGLLSRGRSLLQRLYPSGQLTDEDYTYLHATHGLPRELVTELVSEM
jgi:alanyl-tRNA synthetase